MSFDFQREIDRLREALAHVHDFVSQNVAYLRASTDLQAESMAIARQLDQMLADLPPPEPTPPTSRYTITVEEDFLAHGLWSQWWYTPPQSRQPHLLRLWQHAWWPDWLRLSRWLWWFLWAVYALCGKEDSKYDADWMTLRRVASQHSIDLPDPLLPGSPARTFTVQLQVPQASKRRTGRSFHYRLALTARQCTFTVPAIPPDKPLEPYQKAYVDRKQELASQVYDMRTFLQHWNDRVTGITSATTSLVNNVQHLQSQVATLPISPPTAVLIQDHRNRINSIRHTLDDTQRRLEEDGQALQRLEEELRRICPELRLS